MFRSLAHKLFFIRNKIHLSYLVWTVQMKNNDPNCSLCRLLLQRRLHSPLSPLPSPLFPLVVYRFSHSNQFSLQIGFTPFCLFSHERNAVHTSYKVMLSSSNCTELPHHQFNKWVFTSTKNMCAVRVRFYHFYFLGMVVKIHFFPKNFHPLIPRAFPCWLLRY